MADLVCPEEIFYTKARIVDMVMAQRPERAIDCWENSDDARRQCLTCIISRFKDDDGTEYTFSQTHKQNAVSVRVSTKKQRGGTNVGDELDDGGIGWRDQIMLALSLALVDSKSTGFPIRVYNDGGFSGTYPPDDEVMIREMRLTRAETYRIAFQEVVVDRCDEDVKADVAAFLRHRYEVIAGSDAANASDNMSPEERRTIFPESPDRSFAEVEARLKLRYNCHKNFRHFRPALHFLLVDLPITNGIYTYDVDRLSRDYALSEVMARRIANAGVKVLACTADAGYVTGRDWSDVIMRALHLGAAAEFVRKNMRQILRSHFAALSAGRPISDIPIWMKRDKNKRVTWRREYLPLVEAALRTWMDTQNYKGHRAISSEVNALVRQINSSVENPEHHLKPKRSQSGIFVECSIRYWLHNPMIYGCIQQWGRAWPLAAGEHVTEYHRPLLHADPEEEVSPLALISKKQWERTMRARIVEHPKKRGRTVSNRRALTGLIKCRCGASMFFHDRKNSLNKRDEWVCHSQPDSKRALLEQTGLKWHIGISDEQMMNLINGIMTEVPGLLRTNTVPEVELDARYIKMVAERDRIRAEAREKARGALPDFPEESDAFQSVKRTILKALGGLEVEAQADRIEAEIYRRQQQPEEPTSEEEKSFMSLSPARQNEILHSIIQQIRPVQPHGLTDLRDEYMEIVKKDGVPLAPIRCIQSRIMTNGLPKFRLPTFAEWITSMISVPEPEAIEERGSV